ncbi:hypothetical protein [Bradyrhizobium uaiense]|uniref:hypothetical protein n=1 Tax=Bradyrhizobium uaiense TaxID=2594946 RepID=UPI001F159B70|nr:hypothetical protein [Bradyrhizobium uaiense]
MSKIFRLAVIGVPVLTVQPDPASAINIGASASLPIVKQQDSSSDVVQIRAVVRRGGVAVGPRGGAVAYRSRTVVRPGVRPGWHGAGTRWVGPGPRPLPGPRPGGWVRPGWYGWPVGGALAAGAALGFVTAASAAAWAGAPPASGMCWYYTDPSRTQGFWDYCPR